MCALNNITASQHKKKIMEMIPSDHFKLRMVERSLPLTAIAVLQTMLPQKKLFERVAVLVNGIIVVAERKTLDEAVIITGWRASYAQKTAIKNNQKISARLDKGDEMIEVIAA